MSRINLVVLPEGRRAAVLALAVVLTIPVTAAAQPAPEDAYFEPLPVVLSVSRLAQPVAEAPAAVTVIDQEMIRTSGAREIWELMRLVPGMTVSNAVGQSPAVVFHGLTGQFNRRLQVLIDGRSYFSPFFYGGVNWRQLPVALEDIERIEVVRGSDSVGYGANAAHGIVNIITRQALGMPKATVLAMQGAQGVGDRMARATLQGDDGSLRVTVRDTHDTGIDNYRDDMASLLFNLRGDYRLGVADSVRVDVGQIRTSTDVGEIGDLFDPARRRVVESAHAMLAWQRAMGPGDEVSLRYFRSRERIRDSYLIDYLAVGAAAGLAAPVVTGLFAPFSTWVPLNYDAESVRDDLEFQVSSTPSDTLRTVWGGQWQHDRVHSPGFYFSQPTVAARSVRVFGHAEWRPRPDWLINVGAAWERATDGGAHVSPRASVSWHPAPEHTLRLGAARAYRNPSLFETRSDLAVATADGHVIERTDLAQGATLQAETLRSLELAYLGRWAPIGLSTDLRFFDERADRLIISGSENVPAGLCSAPFIPGRSCLTADDTLNGQRARILGFEHSTEWHLARHTRVRLNQAFMRVRTAVYDRTSRADMASKIPDIERQQDASAPTHSSSVSVTQQLPLGAELSLTYAVQGAMRWTQNSYLPKYRRVDWRLAVPFRIGPTHAELAFVVRNQEGGHAEYRPEHVEPVRAFATLRVDL